MSEKLPESLPVLVPRNNGNIEVWHRTGMLDGHGNHQVIGQFPEEIDGKMGIPEKYVPQELFQPEVQEDLASELGATYEPSPEAPEGNFEANEELSNAQKNLGEQALDVVGVKSPDVAEVKEMVTSSMLTNSLIGGINKAAKGEITNGKGDRAYSPDELKKQYKSFVEKLGPDVDIDNLLKFIPRAGGLRDTVEASLKNGTIEDVKKAFEASLVESPDVDLDQESDESQEVVSESKSELERIDKELKEVEASLPEKDRMPVWDYAIAVNDNERKRALDKMSWKTQDSRIYLRYADLFSQYQAARAKAK